MAILIIFLGSWGYTEGLIFTRQLVLLRQGSRKIESKTVAKRKVKLNENVEMLTNEKRFHASMQIS